MIHDDLQQKRVLSTGDVARYCSVHFRTVIRWIERGSLKAYKLPGRGNNRIEAKDFIHFLKENKMPVPDEFQPATKRILIVDDEIEMSSTIQRIFNRAGYETAIARDGFQAGAMLFSFQPALMTLDLSMPYMDGFAVLEYIGHQEAHQDLKIVVISALDETRLAKARSSGAHRTLAKPFSKKNLLAIASELIE